MYIEVDLVEHFRPHDFSWQLGNLTRCRLVMAALPSASEWPEKRNAGVSVACTQAVWYAYSTTALLAAGRLCSAPVVCDMLTLLLHWS